MRKEEGKEGGLAFSDTTESSFEKSMGGGGDSGGKTVIPVLINFRRPSCFI